MSPTTIGVKVTWGIINIIINIIIKHHIKYSQVPPGANLAFTLPCKAFQALTELKK